MKTASKSKSDKIIIYFAGEKQEGGEQDLAMELEFSSEEESQMQEEKPHSGLFNEQRVNINKQLECQNLGVQNKTKKIKDALIKNMMIKVEEYLVQSKLITNNLKHAGTAKEIFAGRRSNKAKRGLIDNMLLLYGDHTGFSKIPKNYKDFKMHVMNYAFKIYDGWAANKRSAFLEKLLIQEEEKLLINKEENNIQKEIIKFAFFAWLGTRRDIEDEVKKGSGKVLIKQARDFFWKNLREAGINEDRIDKKRLKKKLKYMLKYVVHVGKKLEEKNKVIKCNFIKKPIFRGALKVLYGVIRGPIFFNDAHKLLQESVFSPAPLTRTLVIEQYIREVALEKEHNNIIMPEAYRKLAEELLLPDRGHIEKNNQNNQTNEMYESADEENEGACSDSESKEGEDSFRAVVNNCLNEEKQPLIVKQQKGEEEPVFQSEASEGGASENGNYNFFKESPQHIPVMEGGMVMPKSVEEEDSEEEKRNQ